MICYALVLVIMARSIIVFVSNYLEFKTIPKTPPKADMLSLITLPISFYSDPAQLL